MLQTSSSLNWSSSLMIILAPDFNEVFRKDLVEDNASKQIQFQSFTSTAFVLLDETLIYNQRHMFYQLKHQFYIKIWLTARYHHLTSICTLTGVPPRQRLLNRSAIRALSLYPHLWCGLNMHERSQSQNCGAGVVTLSCNFYLASHSICSRWV